MTPLPLSFYLEEDVVHIARALLGKALFTRIDGHITGGIITETEAYRGPEDKASHAYNNRRTPRTQTMFQTGGIAYVYTCYGIHQLLNVVTNVEDIPHAVLIRALHPTHGLDTMSKRRNIPKRLGKSVFDKEAAQICALERATIVHHKAKGSEAQIRGEADAVKNRFSKSFRYKPPLDPALAKGPGSLTQALGITKEHNGISFDSDLLWIEETPLIISPDLIEATPRIGIDYAAEHAFLPWRFHLPHLRNALAIPEQTG